eukprot:TRINITY_DN26993_c0_g1_i1.p1 TRINITY_DN26993_c0_g1~~TRINITY_DN26993_c0_g1_i1.p1  ORF type:complete len:396 (-),score=55.51 TRINITY_DN26993_c0_g1_i1:198-1385(-)
MATMAIMERPPPLGDLKSQSRLSRTGALISGSDHQRQMQQRPPSSQCSQRSWSSSGQQSGLGPPLPPSARTGLMHSESAPSLMPNTRPASNLASLKNVRLQRQPRAPEGLQSAIWSDGHSHLGDDSWPAHAVPLWVFTGKDRIKPEYKEEVKFTLHDEKYINFAVRLKCGVGDRYGGGSVGIIHSPDRSETYPGAEGQLIQITEVMVQPNNTVVITAVGDLGFRVLESWMPRGLMGLQLGFIEAIPGAGKRVVSIFDTCVRDPSMILFAKMARVVPGLADALSSGGPFTIFLPTSEAITNLGFFEDDLLQRSDLDQLLGCHMCRGKVLSDAMYSGRTFQALDGTILHMTFQQWPRGNPRVNEVPVQHMDILCLNGVIHTLCGMMSPSPACERRRR